VTGLFLLVAAGSVVTAGSAAAIADGTRPDSRVTNGPSCAPGGVVVQVVSGSVPYHVVLATTRTPAGEDATDLRPGQTVELHSRDVAYGETIDSRLDYTALDGSGAHYVDELIGWTFTRPSAADCAAVAAPAAGVVPPAQAGRATAQDVPPQTGVAPQGDPVRVFPAAQRSAVAPAPGSPAPPVVAALALLGVTGGLVSVVRVRARRSASGAPGTLP
jgi:hypothetical protein